jgi:hypothetical protein
VGLADVEEVYEAHRREWNETKSIVSEAASNLLSGYQGRLRELDVNASVRLTLH